MSSYNWVVGIPAWGKDSVDVLLQATLPAVGMALRGASGNVRFVICTDRSDVISNWFILHLPDVRVDYLSKPTQISHKVSKDKYLKLGFASRAILGAVEQGECATLLMADTVVSNDWFSTAELHFAKDKKLIVLYGGGRTPLRKMPPIGVGAEELKRWAWENRHPWISDCLWGSGKTLMPTVLFFEGDKTVVGRGFHLHTNAAFVKDRELSFSTLTADGGKGGFAESNYKRGEIAILTRPDEMAYASISPIDDNSPSGPPLSVERMVGFFKRQQMTDWDKWMFSHRFFLVGDGDPGDREICDKIMMQI